MSRVHYLVNLLWGDCLLGYLWLCTLQAGLAFQTQEKVAIGLDGFFQQQFLQVWRQSSRNPNWNFLFQAFLFSNFFAGIFFQQVCFSGIFFQKYPQVGRMKNPLKATTNSFSGSFFFRCFDFHAVFRFAGFTSKGKECIFRFLIAKSFFCNSFEVLPLSNWVI